uniref:(northern house mosquito) hypothetical protein n=1 Tax=Culex pipiens TaxID=7175 RepID=A0A8D8B8P3_CULPI
MFNCPKCPRSFAGRFDFVEHIKDHEDEMVDYTCFCYTRFDRYMRFRRHFLRWCRSEGNDAAEHAPVLEAQGQHENDAAMEFDEIVERGEDYRENYENSSGSDSDEEDELLQDVRRLDQIWLRLILKLLGDSVLSRTKAIDFIHELTAFKSELLTQIEHELRDFIRQECLENFKKKISDVKSKFKISAESSAQSLLRSNDLFKEPQIDIISSEVQPITKCGERILDRKDENVCNIDLKFALKLFFERENLLELTLLNIQKLKNDASGKISNYIQGKSWETKESELDPEKQYLPIILYNDDFEPDNPLGAHKGKNAQCAFYLSCPVIPKRFRAKLSSLIPAMFIKSKLKKVNPELLFNRLVENLIELQTTGIDIVVKNRIIKIYPVLCAFTGDNLSLNYIGGFTTGFNSTHFCRVCTSTKNETQGMTIENKNTLRDHHQYLRDIERDPKETGINFKCPFISIPTFNVIHAMTFDPMHDFGEGICPFAVALGLRDIIANHDFIDLQILNQRKDLFDYGMYQINNLSEAITQSHLRDEGLKMSSCEMFTFLEFLPMMIGDLIEENNPHWKYLLLLRRIVLFTFKSSFSLDEINTLQNMIQEHHTTFIRLFDRPLKPKMHFLLHYPSAILQNGPLENTDCRRFESKNRDIKQYSRANFNRRNLSKSIGIKESYKIAFHSFIVYQEHEFHLLRPKNVKVELLETTIGLNYEPDDVCRVSRNGFFDNIRFSPNSCFKIGDNFVKVNSLFVHRNMCYAIVQKIHIIDFCPQMECFHVADTNNDEIPFCYDLSEINNFPQTIHNLNNGKLGIFPPKYMN